MWKAMKEMLPYYYGTYLNQFYLQDRDAVEKNIFDLMAIQPQSRELILNHEKYGWYSNTSNLAAWFRLAHLPPDARLAHPDFELIR